MGVTSFTYVFHFTCGWPGRDARQQSLVWGARQPGSKPTVLPKILNSNPLTLKTQILANFFLPTPLTVLTWFFWVRDQIYYEISRIAA